MGQSISNVVNPFVDFVDPIDQPFKFRPLIFGRGSYEAFSLLFNNHSVESPIIKFSLHLSYSKYRVVTNLWST